MRILSSFQRREYNDQASLSHFIFNASSQLMPKINVIRKVLHCLKSVDFARRGWMTLKSEKKPTVDWSSHSQHETWTIETVRRARSNGEKNTKRRCQNCIKDGVRVGSRSMSLNE